MRTYVDPSDKVMKTFAIVIGVLGFMVLVSQAIIAI